jgi:hypothetical protein
VPTESDQRGSDNQPRRHEFRIPIQKDRYAKINSIGAPKCRHLITGREPSLGPTCLCKREATCNGGQETHEAFSQACMGRCRMDGKRREICRSPCALGSSSRRPQGMGSRSLDPRSQGFLLGTRPLVIVHLNCCTNSTSGDAGTAGSGRRHLITMLLHERANTAGYGLSFVTIVTQE